MIEIKHLKLVRALRQHGNLTQAAHSLYLTQSALSHQLRQVEDYFAEKIYIRKTIPIVFTELGEHLLELADQVIPLVEKIQRRLGEQKKQEQLEKLTVYSEFYGFQPLLLPILKNYSASFPSMYVEYASALETIVSQLDKQRMGVGLMARVKHPVLDPMLRYDPICSYELVALLPENHPLLTKKYLDISDFLSYPLICFAKRLEEQDIFHHFLDLAYIHPKLIRVDSITSMIHYVLLNKGLATIPSCLISSYVPLEIMRTLKIGAEGLFGTVYGVTHMEMTNDKPIERLLELLRSSYKAASI